MRTYAAIALALFAATPAFAHPGHEGLSMGSGLLHPLTGVDHMAAMLMVGLWAGLVAGRARWLLPASFLAAMALGYAYGATLPLTGLWVERLVILSLVALGTVLVLRPRTPLALAAGAAGLFGFTHGMAHGADTAGHASLGFAGGFLIATALLHGAGLLLARQVPARWARLIGAAGAGFGLLLAGAA